MSMLLDSRSKKSSASISQGQHKSAALEGCLSWLRADFQVLATMPECQAVASGAIDGWIELEPEGAWPRLRLRRGCAVIEPVPPGAASDLPQRLSGLALRDIAEAAGAVLRALGWSGPLVAFAVPAMADTVGMEGTLARKKQEQKVVRTKMTAADHWVDIG